MSKTDAMNREPSYKHFEAAIFLILKKDNKVLLMKRKNTGWMDGHYGLPAGKVDDNESAVDAAVREANEELGLDLTEDKVDLAFTSFVNYIKARRFTNWIYYFFKVDWSGQEPKNMEPNKSEEIEWFHSLEGLELTPLVRETFQDIDKGLTSAVYASDAL